MRVIETVAELVAALDAERAAGRVVGLVPTMGALHAGHRSLVERAAAECDAVVVTVFVNPLQFDDGADLDAYPRTLATDVALAAGAGAAFVFAPSVAEMYPGYPAPPATTVHVGGLTERFEGASRPGHFDGVATVVTKLMAMAGRCRAYFGEKDLQQLAVVRRLVADLSLPVEVVGCPTVREPDGLALSSRNTRLSRDERRAATALYRALQAGAAVAAGAAGAIDGVDDAVGAVRSAMRAVLEAEPLVTPDYADVVDPGSMTPADTLDGERRMVVAAFVGDVRLLDNLAVPVAAVPMPAVARAGPATG